MFEHRRKIAVAVALILALGSAAASAANFVNGNGMRPSFGGASDALDMAMSGAGKATNWMITRSRNSVDRALAFIDPPSVRPPEVPYVPESPPMVKRGPVTPVHIAPERPYGYGARASAEPERTYQRSFADVLGESMSAAGVPSVDPSVDPGLPGSSSGGGGSPTVPEAEIVAPVSGLAALREPVVEPIPIVPSVEPGLPSDGGGSPTVPDVVVVAPFPGLATIREPVVEPIPIVTSVPEPEFYVMLLAGLGVLGIVARRRGKSAAV